MKRLLIISDLHCGHRYGLTPPRWWMPDDTREGKIQRTVWEWYSKTIEALKPFDVCIVNGDSTDGSGRINNGVELITTNMLTQVDMAEEALGIVEAKKYGFIIGSGYHTGRAEDVEKVLSDKMDGLFCESRNTVEINGTIFDFRHEVGGTGIPHGKASAINKENLWALLRHEKGLSPRVDVLVRSHVHKLHATFDTDGLRLTTPAMQYESNYGVRKFSGLIDMGFIVFDINGPGDYTWKPYILDLKPLSKGVTRI